jgi:hypothetical protein
MTGIRTIWILLFFFTSLLHGSLFSQNQEFHYKFLNLQDNKFLNIEDTARYWHFMSKLRHFREGASMDVVHIGDSHMQAGFYSNQIRSHFHQHYETDTLANLGFIFPYAVAGTNNGRAREQGCAFGDFYQVMGGDHSIQSWCYNDLTAKDRRHLNKKGYQLKADLFFNAFLNSMADMQTQTAEN